MKLIFAVVMGAMLHVALSAAIEEVEKEFDLIEKDLASSNIEKEILDWAVPESVAKEEKAMKLNSPIEVKDASNQNKDNSVESQLEDLVKNTDAKDKKKDSSAKSDLHKMLSNFENTGNIDKDQLMNAIEKYMKKDDVAADLPSEDNGECKDNRKNCKYLARLGYCGTHKKTMQSNCAKTCQFCVDCKNVAGSRCVSFRKYGYCESAKYKARMKYLCFKECDYCRPPSAPKCAESAFGCCWDKVTVKAEKTGTSCPKCEDKYLYVCDRFKEDCQKISRAGTFMRRMCPQTCGKCDNKCEDMVEWAEKCPYYLKSGQCKSDPHGMKLLCKKTCGFCTR
ncbi:uncharacterized protein LOC135687668 [Rhopilema esculentum]|uniref:uncharacterized protein LOC135687668 n=1 Tax=Rhopilema esculentum TaxID=499914 RepID=UPI0031DAA713|eukprot:gene6478-11931_t